MLPKNTSSLGFDTINEQKKEFQIAFSAAKRPQPSFFKSRSHRSIACLKVTPYLMTQAIALPLVLVTLIYWGQPLIFEFWKTCIEFWSSNLDYQFSLTSTLSENGRVILHVIDDPNSAYLPSFNVSAITTVLTLLGFVLSLRMNKACLPLKYPLRIVCAVQFATLLYFWTSPSNFLYRVTDHSEELLSIGYVVMLTTPVMLAMGYYILNQGLFEKVVNTLLILVFLGVMIPHQVLAQALIMTHASILFMPVLYLCFGAVFDALAFIALYSWIVSNVTVDATT